MKHEKWTNPYMDLVRSKPGYIVQARDAELDEDQILTLREHFRQQAEIYIEPGSGSGGHLIERASRSQTACFIGFELRYKRAFNTAKKADRLGLKNLTVIRGSAREIPKLFSPDSLSGAYVNFPDPWSKRKWHKHRMLNAQFLDELRVLLKTDGFLAYKTDHAECFEDTCKLLKNHAGYTVTKMSQDLYNSAYLPDNVQSEFEKLFRSKGLPIFYLEARKNS